MQSIKEQKAAHALRSNITSEDEYYSLHRKEVELTEEQKEILLQQEEERKKLYAQEIEARKKWMEKYYADKTDRELNNW